MANSRHDTVREIIAEVFQVDPSTINDRTAYGTIQEWDSQNHVRLLLALEEEFDVSFEVAEIESMTDIDKILATLETKL